MIDTHPMQIECRKNPATASILRPPCTESWQERIPGLELLSTSIVHDLRNPLGAVLAGAEMLMELDPTSTQGKRLAGNIYRAASRMRELLAELAGANRRKELAYEMCKIHDVIAAASEAALPAAETP